MADIAVTRFAVTTAAAGNTQDVTISGFGTPSAVLFFHSSAVTDGAVAAHSWWGVSATDGITSYATVSRGEDAAATSNVARVANSARLIQSISNSADSQDGYLEFSTWITDGVRISVTDAVPAASLVTAIFFSSNVQAKLINRDLGTVTTAQDINTVGFTPDVVMAFLHGEALSGVTAFNTPSFGVAVNDGSATQKAIMWRNRDAQADSQIITYYADGKAGGSLAATSGAVFYDLTISDFDASGFSVTASSSAGSDVVSFLALKLPTGHQFKLFDTSVPTTGSIAVTSPNFTPYFGLMGLLAGPTTANTIDSTNGAVAAVAAFDAASIYTMSASSADAAPTMVEKSLSDNSFTLLRASDGTVETTSSGYALDSQGWDITLTANPAAAVLGWALAIGAGAAPAAGGIRNPLFGPVTLRNALGRFN